MTALDKYERLEASGLWRSDPASQKRDVIVSVGKTSLTISDPAGRAMSHWMLTAIDRVNPGAQPAIYSPGAPSPEELETEDADLIDAIEILRAAIERRRPRAGRLRGIVLSTSVLIIVLVGWFVLPSVLVAHADRIVPDAKRQDIGQNIARAMQRWSGPACQSPLATPSLMILANRLTPSRADPGRIMVYPNGPDPVATLPGPLFILDRTLVEDHDAPDVMAGYLIEERLRNAAQSPLKRFLNHAGHWSALRLMTTGKLPDAAYSAYAEHILKAPADPVPPDALIAAFAEHRVPTIPFARDRDVTGETTLDLIEAEAIAPLPVPILTDADWVRLQSICDS